MRFRLWAALAAFSIAVVSSFPGDSTAGSQPSGVVVDPEIRAAVVNGRARVLVEVRLDERRTMNRAAHIADTQEKILARLPRGHATVTRRYSSIPLIALEIDRLVLSMLETMPDLVVSVRSDRTARPQ